MNKLQLIIDNDPINRTALKMLLDNNGYKCEVSKKFISTDYSKYDTIWINIDPICRKTLLIKINELRDKLNFSGTLIALTAHSDCDIHNICLKNGINYILNKPVTEKNLLNFLNYILIQQNRISLNNN